MASDICRWQYASGCPPRPRIHPGIRPGTGTGTGSNGRTWAHSRSVMSVGYRRSRSG